MTTTVQERQQLAAQLRQVATDNAFVYQAGLLDKRLRALPDVPSFDEAQVTLGSTSQVLRSSHDCTNLVTLGGGIERAHALDDGYYLCFSGKALVSAGPKLA